MLPQLNSRPRKPVALVPLCCGETLDSPVRKAPSTSYVASRVDDTRNGRPKKKKEAGDVEARARPSASSLREWNVVLLRERRDGGADKAARAGVI